MSKAHIGKHFSEETKRKMSEAKLNNPELKGNSGSLRHQKYVLQTASILKQQYKNVETEKPIRLSTHHRRIIDILVDGQICYEIGQCPNIKIQELEQNGFAVVHLPYSVFSNIEYNPTLMYN